MRWGKGMIRLVVIGGLDGWMAGLMNLKLHEFKNVKQK